MKTFKLLFWTLCLIFLSVSAMAQVTEGDILFKNNFGGNNADIYRSVTAIPDGLIAVGYSNAASFNTGDWTGIAGKGGEDAIIVKYDNDFNIVWKKNFGGNNIDWYNAVTAVSDGIIVAGLSYETSFGTGDWTGISGNGQNYYNNAMDVTIVKYDYDGNIMWKRNFGGLDREDGLAITPVSDGVVIVGYSVYDSFGNGDWTGVSGKGGNSDAIIIKYDNNGNLVWQKNFGGSSSESFYSVTTVSDGVIAVGNSNVNSFNTGDWVGVSGKGNDDAIIVKYDNNGNVVWKKNFGGSADDFFNYVTTVSDGVVAVGYSSNGSFGNGDWVGVTGNGSADAIIVKYDNNGNVVWKKNFGGAYNDNYSSVTTVLDGIIAVGTSSGAFGTGDLAGITGKGGTDAIIVKYDNNGNVVWKKNFGGNYEDYFRSVTAVDDGVVVVGYAASGSFNTGDLTGILGKGNFDAIIVKYAMSVDCETLVDILQAQINQLITENNALISDTILLNQQIISLQNNLNTANNTINALQSDTAALHQQIDNLQNDLNTTNNTISALQSDTAVLNQQIINLQNDLDDLQALLDECRNSGVSNVQSVSLKIYPNPVQPNGILTLENETLKYGDKIEIYDMSGKLVSTHFAAGTSNSIQIGSLPQGAYLLKLAGKNGVKFEIR